MGGINADKIELVHVIYRVARCRAWRVYPVVNRMCECLMCLPGKPFAILHPTSYGQLHNGVVVAGCVS